MVDGHPRLLWRATGDVTVERIESWLGGMCRIRGGEWLESSVQESRLVVGGAPLRRFDDYFQPLLAFPIVRVVT
jgi:hypothetical protein